MDTVRFSRDAARHDDIESHSANRDRVACSVVTLHAYRTSARTPQSTRARNYIVTPRVFNLSDAPLPPPPPSLSTFALSHPYRPAAAVAFDATSTLPCQYSTILPFSRRRKPFSAGFSIWARTKSPITTCHKIPMLRTRSFDNNVLTYKRTRAIFFNVSNYA